MSKEEVEPSEGERCFQCGGEGEVAGPTASGWADCATCGGPARQPAAQAEPARRGLQTNGPSAAVRMQRQEDDRAIMNALAEAEREEPMQRRKTVEQMKAEGRHVSAGRAPFVSYPYETLESVRETYWADRAQELEALFQRTHNVHASWVAKAQQVDALKAENEKLKAAYAELRAYDAKAGPYEEALEKLSALTAEAERMRSENDALKARLLRVAESFPDEVYQADVEEALKNVTGNFVDAEGRAMTATAEAERLRSEVAELNHVIAQNQATYRANTEDLRAEVKLLKDCCADWEEHHALQVKAIRERDAALAALVDALKSYVEYKGLEHDDPCPEDDTCECSDVLALSREFDAALRLLGREPTGSEESSST